MDQIDLRKLALRLKIIEMLHLYVERRKLQEAHTLWRQLICSN